MRLPADAPLNREWFVVCDAADLPAFLAAVELPRERAVADNRRTFEALWSVDPQVVRTASRAAAAIADLSAGDASIVEAAAGEIRLPVADASASAEAVRRLDARAVPVAAVELQQPSLDDVFLTLTGRRAEDTVKEAA